METCSNCGDRDCNGVMTMGTDPYAVEINDDYTEYLNCEGGRWASALEI